MRHERVARLRNILHGCFALVAGALRILARWRKQGREGLAFRRKQALDLAKLLGDDSIKAHWLRPLDAGQLMVRDQVAPRGVIHRGAHIGDEIDIYLRLGFPVYQC